MVLLLDEPSSGFDASSRKSLISTGYSVLTMHSTRDAHGLADRAGMMSGRVLTLGTPRGLRRRWGDV